MPPLSVILAKRGKFWSLELQLEFLGIGPGDAGRKAAELIERLDRVRQPNNGGQGVKTTLGQQTWTWKLNVEMMEMMLAWRNY